MDHREVRLEWPLQDAGLGGRYGDLALPRQQDPPLGHADCLENASITYGVNLAAGVAERMPRMTFNCLRDSNSGFFLEVYS
jgi:hypothetical protein